jgi:hypothetical protein
VHTPGIAYDDAASGKEIAFVDIVYDQTVRDR